MSESIRRVGGMGWATVDGLSVPVVANPTYRASKVIRETVSDMGGDHNYLEKPQAGIIKFQCRDLPGVGIAAYESMSDVTVDVRLNSGKFITGKGMWNVSAVEVNAADGTFDLEFHGNEVTVDE